MEFLIGLLFGIVAGYVLFQFFKKDKPEPSGTFIIDFSDPMKDVCRLELDEDLEAIYTKKQILLNVKTFDISQQ